MGYLIDQSDWTVYCYTGASYLYINLYAPCIMKEINNIYSHDMLLHNNLCSCT